MNVVNLLYSYAPLILTVTFFIVKMGIELFLVRIIDDEVQLVFKRLGQEFCFLGLSFFGLALLDQDSYIYNDSLLTFASFITIVFLYAFAVAIYKYYYLERLNPGQMRFRQWLVLVFSTAPGIAALMFSLKLLSKL